MSFKGFRPCFDTINEIVKKDESGEIIYVKKEVLGFHIITEDNKHDECKCKSEDNSYYNTDYLKLVDNRIYSDDIIDHVFEKESNINKF